DRGTPSQRSTRSGHERRSAHSAHHHHRYHGGEGENGNEDFQVPAASPYHTTTQRRHQRGSQSCYNAFSDDFDRFSNMNRSFTAAVHPRFKELRNELRVTTDRKNYYKDLYKRERQNRIRDRELRDLVEKKLMDDLKEREMEYSNCLLRIKSLEQQLQHQSNFPPPMRESTFRVPHFCTPSTSHTASTMAGAGEALSSTSELFGLRSAYLTSPPVPGSEAIPASLGVAAAVVPENSGEMPDETKVFRQPDESALELPRNSSNCDDSDEQVGVKNSEAVQNFETDDVKSSVADVLKSCNDNNSKDNNGNINGTVLEEEAQSDTGYGTTSECASDLRRVHSDSDLPLQQLSQA
ncbi:unnamed protein product, partial [Gongylonema pulchrum]|uniref:Polo-like kinase 1 substrate 1 n=1 Tax=Gongylonema pulchrum TaxID=637853 RepID=A0A183CV30_9BILA